MKKTIGLLLFSIPFCLFANKTDSLKNIALASNNANAWNNMAEYCVAIKDTSNLKNALEQSFNLLSKKEDHYEFGRYYSYYATLANLTIGVDAYLEPCEKALFHFEKAKDYDLQIILLNNIGQHYSSRTLYQKAIEYYSSAQKIVQEHEHELKKPGLPYLYFNWGSAYLSLGSLDSVIVYNELATKYAIQEKDTFIMMHALRMQGMTYLRKNMYKESLQKYNDALELHSLSGNSQLEIHTLYTISDLYHKWKKGEQGLKFARIAEEKSRKSDFNPITLANVYKHLAVSLFDNHLYQSAIDTARLTLNYKKENPLAYYDGLLILARVHESLGNIDSTSYFLNKIESVISQNKNLPKEVYHLFKAGFLSRQDKLLDAIDDYEEYIRITKEKSRINQNYEAYNMLAKAYEEKKDYKRALDNKKEAFEIIIKIHQEEYSEFMSEFQTKYETSQKELKIGELNEKTKTLAYERTILIGGIIFSAILLLLLTLYLRMKRLHQEKQEALMNSRIEEKDREYQALQLESETNKMRSYIDGLEVERKRLSKDLHDDVSNELVAIKMQIENGTSNDKLIESLGRLHTNIRNISHGLTPPIFKHATLQEVLEDYVFQLNNQVGVKLSLDLTSDKEWGAIPDEVNVEIYRIVQEATGNALKHSNASDIRIMGENLKNSLVISITDNGDGFDTEREYQGLGLKILKERAKLIGGNLDISSDSNGTKIKLHLISKS